jgi:hypothetical protein
MGGAKEREMKGGLMIGEKESENTPVIRLVPAYTTRSPPTYVPIMIPVGLYATGAEIGDWY